MEHRALTGHGGGVGCGEVGQQKAGVSSFCCAAPCSYDLTHYERSMQDGTQTHLACRPGICYTLSSSIQTLLLSACPTVETCCSGGMHLLKSYL